MIGDVRGRGLMIGIEFSRPSSWKLRGAWTALQTARVKGCSRRPSSTRCSTGTGSSPRVSGDHLEVIKLIPPLVIAEAEVDRFVEAFTDVMDDAHKGAGLMWDFGRSLIKQAATARTGAGR